MILATLSEQVDHKTKAEELRSSVLSKLTFWWTNRIIKIGYKREISREDLFDIDEKEKAEWNSRKLEAAWNPKARK